MASRAKCKVTAGIHQFRCIVGLITSHFPSILVLRMSAIFKNRSDRMNTELKDLIQVARDSLRKAGQTADYVENLITPLLKISLITGAETFFTFL